MVRWCRLRQADGVIRDGKESSFCLSCFKSSHPLTHDLKAQTIVLSFERMRTCAPPVHTRV